jgi:carbon-monoxide dehydrogenase large subunit
VAEVDLETGDVRLARFFAVDDCGRIINPLLAEGQVHGGIAQGIGQALLEEVVFDDQGTPRTASLLDYLIPTIGEIPEVVTATTETPSPNNPLGAKGMGETGIIGMGAAIGNAIDDALQRPDTVHSLPVTPERMVALLETPVIA